MTAGRVGLPGESEQTMRQTVQYAVDSGLTWAQFTPFHFVPGSPLHDRQAARRRCPPESLTRPLMRAAYWKFYGTKHRWRAVLRSINRRNAVRLAGCIYDKMLRGTHPRCDTTMRRHLKSAGEVPGPRPIRLCGRGGG